MRTKKVIVEKYNEKWKIEFNKIKQELLETLGDLVIGVEHIGSTAVEGISAKPIIDIDIIIKNYDSFSQVVKKLSKMGYTHEGNLGIKDREAFSYENKPEHMLHHLYVCPQASKELQRNISFRDYLRTHPVAMRKYSKIKEEAVNLFPNDIDKYIQYKSGFIEEIYAAIVLDEDKHKSV